jgi:hypothetical protein
MRCGSLVPNFHHWTWKIGEPSSPTQPQSDVDLVDLRGGVFHRVEASEDLKSN